MRIDTLSIDEKEKHTAHTQQIRKRFAVAVTPKRVKYKSIICRRRIRVISGVLFLDQATNNRKPHRQTGFIRPTTPPLHSHDTAPGDSNHSPTMYRISASDTAAAHIH
jgi:hypothetical protein